MNIKVKKRRILILSEKKNKINKTDKPLMSSTLLFQEAIKNAQLVQTLNGGSSLSSSLFSGFMDQRKDKDNDHNKHRAFSHQRPFQPPFSGSSIIAPSKIVEHRIVERGSNQQLRIFEKPESTRNNPSSYSSWQDVRSRNPVNMPREPSTFGNSVEILVDREGKYGGGLIIRNRLATRFALNEENASNNSFMVRNFGESYLTFAEVVPYYPSKVLQMPRIQLALSSGNARLLMLTENFGLHPNALSSSLLVSQTQFDYISDTLALRMCGQFEQNFVVNVSGVLEHILVWILVHPELGSSNVRIPELEMSMDVLCDRASCLCRRSLFENYSSSCQDERRVSDNVRDPVVTRCISDKVRYRLPITTTEEELAQHPNSKLVPKLMKLRIHPPSFDNNNAIEKSQSHRLRTVFQKEVIKIQLRCTSPQVIFFANPYVASRERLPDGTFFAKYGKGQHVANQNHCENDCTTKEYNPYQQGVYDTCHVNAHPSCVSPSNNQGELHPDFQEFHPEEPSPLVQEKLLRFLRERASVAAQVPDTRTDTQKASDRLLLKSVSIASSGDMPPCVMMMDALGTPLEIEDTPFVQWTPSNVFRISNY